MYIIINKEHHLITRNKAYEVINSDSGHYLVHNDMKRALVVPKYDCTETKDIHITNKEFIMKSIRNYY